MSRALTGDMALCYTCGIPVRPYTKAELTQRELSLEITNNWYPPKEMCNKHLPHCQRTKAKRYSGIEGVTWCERNQKWNVRVTIDGVRKGLGYYEEIEDAAEALEKQS